MSTTIPVLPITKGDQAGGVASRLLLAAASIAAAFAILSAEVKAQTLQSMAIDSTCRCRIALRMVAALGDHKDAVAVRPNSVLARDGMGRFLAGVTQSESSISVFSPSGKPLSTFGRQGGGPGELGRVRHVRVARGDSILTLDRTRLTLFAPSGSPVRWGNLPSGVQSFRFSVLPTGHVVVNNYMPSHPSLILLDQKFRAMREFGSTTPRESRNDSDAIQYWIASLDSGRFAAVRQNYRYEIEIWDTVGTLVRRFDRTPTWYKPWTQAAKLARGGSDAFPVVLGAYADGQRLWVAARVPDPTWKEPKEPPRSAGRGREIARRPSTVAELDRRFDTIIEVLDLATGRVQVSQRFDALITQFTEDGLLYGVREAPSLLLRLDVWRPEVVRLRQ